MLTLTTAVIRAVTRNLVNFPTSSVMPANPRSPRG